MLKLPNGKPIDLDMVEMAMEDSSRECSYFLNTQTGEVTHISEYDCTTEEREALSDEIDGSDDYVRIERITSEEAYRWMEDFVEQVVAPKNALAAEKLSIALMGKGAFRRFKDVLSSVGEKWVQAWYRWRDDRLHEAIQEWFASLSLEITEELPTKHP